MIKCRGQGWAAEERAVLAAVVSLFIS